jgi:DNA-binding MarR family transcriptional regulator
MRQDALQQDSPDVVDAIVEQWGRERPDLDPTAKHVTGRIIRLAAVFQSAYSEVFAPLGLNDGDYGVLATLRRAGAPYRLTPTDLARHQMMTSGGMTAAIDRLERKGLVARLANPNDRRGSLIELTHDGRSVVDRAMELHVDAESRLVHALSAAERKTLQHLLRKLVLSVEAPEGVR